MSDKTANGDGLRTELADLRENLRITNGRIGETEGDVIRVGAALFHHGTEFRSLRDYVHATNNRFLEILMRIEAHLGVKP